MKNKGPEPDNSDDSISLEHQRLLVYAFGGSAVTATLMSVYIWLATSWMLGPTLVTSAFMLTAWLCFWAVNKEYKKNRDD